VDRGDNINAGMMLKQRHKRKDMPSGGIEAATMTTKKVKEAKSMRFATSSP